jgi:hypothetical protein
LDGTSQFDVAFSAYWRAKDDDQNDHDDEDDDG